MSENMLDLKEYLQNILNNKYGNKYDWYIQLNYSIGIEKKSGVLKWRTADDFFGMIISKHNSNDIVIFHKGLPYIYIVNEDLKHGFYKNYPALVINTLLIDRTLANGKILYIRKIYNEQLLK